MKLNKVKGFTIAETMLALLMVYVCFGILQNTLSVVKNNEIAYSYIQLDKFLKREEHIEIYPASSNTQKIVLRKLVSKKESKNPSYENYVVEGYKNMIRLRGIDGGHVPLLMNVKSYKFSYEDDEFTIQVNEEKNGKSEMVFKVDKPLEIDKNIKAERNGKKDSKKQEDKNNAR